ncbi:sensor histidine kinase [Solicola gregarius]|uniref:histidine kinase n=1 Tax=Solicola gregarius TaxID=2908642 RepID=A0AA46TGQ8_9ACTN|nr:HAMP domain-containing sensor histidine kinase [Solicola gregarius]UYM04487.1 HAMP domain-containing histidine kinase [Solicola gregarius]
MTTFTTLTVRARITIVVALLTALALVLAGVSAYVVEMRRLDREVTASMEQEVEEFNTLADRGEDPATGKRFTSIYRLMETFMSRNVPEANEMIFATLSGHKGRYLGGPGLRDEAKPFGEREEFKRTVADLSATGGGTTTIDSPLGKAIVVVQPATDNNESGAFVVVHLIERQRDELYDVMRTFGIVAGISWLIVTLIAFVLTGRLLRPVRRMQTTAQQIAQGDLSRRMEVSGNNDLTELTRTVNDMLDRIEWAFQTQRQLLDDAGHELRTPLTVLQGHLEIADPGDAAEIEQTRELLLDEIARMTRLVEDILMLAKSQRPDFVQPSDVDLNVLVGTVLEKCRALGERTWKIDACPEASVRIDGQRITQALLQLAHNAVRHTEHGDLIAIGARLRDGRAEFWVRDTGPGIAPEDRGHIFHRFRRGSDTTRDEGFGLGLSIVSAIAEAHGGYVQLDDPPIGATLRIVVPVGDAHVRGEA